jgi:hypothetical protein
VKEFRIVQMKVSTLLEGEIVAKEYKYTVNFKNSSPEPTV